MKYLCFFVFLFYRVFARAQGQTTSPLEHVVITSKKNVTFKEKSTSEDLYKKYNDTIK